MSKQFLDVPAGQQQQMRLIANDEDFQEILEDPKLADLNEGPSHTIVIDVECLAMLNKIPEAVDHLKSELKNELQSIVSRSTQHLIDAGPYPQGDIKLLQELFSMMVQQIGLVVEAFKVFQMSLSKSVSRHNQDNVRFDVADVWHKAQIVMQGMLTDYLDFKRSKSAAMQQQENAMGLTINIGGLGIGIGSSGGDSGGGGGGVNASVNNIADINAYFVRRKGQKPKREQLFRFDYSHTALTMNDYLKEQNSDSTKEKSMVCQPNPHNITPIYPALMDFVSVVDSALQYEPGHHCILYQFLLDYIGSVFLGQIRADNGIALNTASLSLDSWKVITDSDVLRELRVKKPLLESTVGVKKSIDELSKYMRTLPLYCQDFLTMMCNHVLQYKEICLAAYRGVVQPDSEDKRIISAQWATDEDISRLLKSLPNWQLAVSDTLSIIEGGEGQAAAAVSSESPQEVEQRNAQETSTLKKNLGDTDIPVHKIFNDSGQLRSLAQLQESLDWFSKNVLALANDFSLKHGGQAGLDRPKLPENSVQALKAQAREFEELSATCLLVLHLEVRVHCFHYLHPIWRGTAGAGFNGGQESTDPNHEVTKLTQDLLQIEEELTASLQERKTRYIFEGVSHLISVIFIAAAEHINKINSNGVKKMCRNIFNVQQTLNSRITGSRETSLDHAKQYYELFNQRPQEIIDGIVEKGPVFSHEEYVAAISLLHRSDPTSTEQLRNMYVEKLADTMKQVGVTV